MTLNEQHPDLLVLTPEGSIRVAGTRITLESIIQAFQEGATPEEICQDFPTLSLAQVYEVVAFYLTHHDQVDAYLAEQTQVAAALRHDLQMGHTAFLANLRHRLAARRSSASPTRESGPLSL